MSRYTNDLPLNKPVDFVQFMMNDYLSKNGFSTAEWKGQPVYRAGDPMLEGYKFMTWSYINGVLHVEAWLKGLFGGEMGLTGFVGCLQKKPFKQSLEQLYTLMRQDILTDQMNAGAAGIAGGTANAGAVPVTTVNNTSAATISLIFGILGCLTGLLVPIAGLCCGVLAVMRGRLGLGSTKAKMAKAGRVLGIIACVLSIVMWVLNIILTVL